ncbi:hypothetical protein ACM26V_07150 [Salipaludibacillus sp. HK11]|uniref:fluoroquinolone export ABC transporter permease subunit n=1 Tax=Salipaludibacillus sp. HK11 TaxID=3394320 RepID=UPI0039FCD431
MIGRLLLQDIRFQYRHGFYYVYAFVTVVYIALLLWVPLDARPFWSVLIIFTDPGTFGFFFVGTIIMLERNQQLLTYLFVTPAKLWHYLVAKIVSLTLIALLTGLLIAFVSLGTSVSFLWLTLSLILCSLFFTSVGLIISPDAGSLNHFMFRAIVLMVVLFTPVLYYVDWLSWNFLQLTPTYSALFLLRVAVNGGVTEDGMSWLPIINHIVLLLGWSIIAFFLAYKRFYTFIIARTGDGKKVSI